jgi:hypothetical protein
LTAREKKLNELIMYSSHLPLQRRNSGRDETYMIEVPTRREPDKELRYISGASRSPLRPLFSFLFVKGMKKGIGKINHQKAHAIAWMDRERRGRKQIVDNSRWS